MIIFVILTMTKIMAIAIAMIKNGKIKFSIAWAVSYLLLVPANNKKELAH